MTTSSAIRQPFSVRVARTLVVLAFRLASASTVHADPPQPERFAEDLREAHYARVGIAGRTYVLVKPRVLADGLGFDHIEGSQRPAIITGADWDSLGSIPNPMPWSSIDRIEAGIQTRRPGALIGGALGLLGGLTLGSLIWMGESLSGEETKPEFVVGMTAFTTVVGAGIGALFPTRRWEQIHLEASGARP